jgi:hypothetical protein
LIEKYFSIGDLRIKTESDYNYPYPAHITAFEVANQSGIVDLHIRVISNNAFTYKLDRQIYIDQNWFSAYETTVGDSILIFQPDDICNITHIWVSASRNYAEIFIEEKLLSNKNISFIESTPFLMLFMTVLIHHSGFILHSAGILVDGKGYVFCGKSGSGKSTISNLFKQCGKTILLTDESLLLRERNGIVHIYGTPWKGSGDNIYNNSKASLEHIYFIFHGENNTRSEIDKCEAIRLLVKQAFPYFWDKKLMLQNFSLMTSIVNLTPCYRLHFLPNNSVVSYITHRESIYEITGRTN